MRSREAAVFDDYEQTIAARRGVVLPDTEDVAELARSLTRDCIQTLGEIVTDRYSATTSRISAATALLDRAHGKPHQSSSVQGGLTFNVVCNIPALPNSARNPITIEHDASA